MAENSFQVMIIAPGGIFYEGTAGLLELNTLDGEIGILQGHIPMTIILKPGVVRIYEPGGGEGEVMISVGFAEILPNKVTILTEKAV